MHKLLLVYIAALIGTLALAEDFSQAAHPLPLKLEKLDKGLTQISPGPTGIQTIEEEDFLAVDAAFQPQLQKSSDQVEVFWTIAADYFLYRHSIEIRQLLENGKAIDITDTFNSSASIRKSDPYFGQVQVFYNRASYSQTNTVQPLNPENLVIQVAYQGCADKGLCYPIQTKTLVLESAL